MIDITVDEKVRRVEIDTKEYPLFYQADIVNLIHDIVDKAKYSGETVSLWYVQGLEKKFVKQWF